MSIFPIIFFALYLINLNLDADTIKLKDGKLIEGRILNESEEEVIIKTHTGKIEINKKRISNIKIGYVSVRACYILIVNQYNKNCSKQLYQLSQDKAKFVTKNASDPPDIILLSEISELEIFKEGDEDIIPFLTEEIHFEFTLRENRANGRIISKRTKSILVINDSGLTQEIYENDILAVNYKNKIIRMERSLSVTNKDPIKAKLSQNIHHYLIPGTGQYERGEIKKSMLFFSTTFLLTAGILNQYNEAKTSASNQNYLLIPSESGIIILNDTNKSKSNFEMYQRNYYLLASSLVFTFILNSLDIRPTMPDKHRLGFDLMVLPDVGNRMSSSIQIEYSIRF